LRLSYDEIMIGRGRSIHTTTVRGKSQPDGFKCWVIAGKGYLYDWLYYSGAFGMYSFVVVELLVLLFLIVCIR
jgi:hypothetical protein